MDMMIISLSNGFVDALCTFKANANSFFPVNEWYVIYHTVFIVFLVQSSSEKKLYFNDRNGAPLFTDVNMSSLVKAKI